MDGDHDHLQRLAHLPAFSNREFEFEFQFLGLWVSGFGVRDVGLRVAGLEIRV